MKEVIGEYGKAILSAVVTLLLFGILFGKLRFHEKNYITVKPTVYEAYKDAKETKETMQKEKPSIEPIKSRLYVGDVKKPEELFFGKDADGNFLPAELLEIEGPNHAEVDITKEGVVFLEPGIYHLLIQVTDKNSIVTRKVFSVPVGHR